MVRLAEKLVLSSRTFFETRQSLHGTVVPRTVAPLAWRLVLGDLLGQAETYCRQQAECKAEERRTLQMVPDFDGTEFVCSCAGQYPCATLAHHL